MQYRQFGNTGVSVSTLGFGCMRFPERQLEDGTWEVEQEKVNAMLMRAYELGVNYFDSAYFYCHQNSETAIGKALKSVRDKVYLSTKCPMDMVKKPEDFEAILDTSLARLDTNYVDFYHFWSINRKVFDEKILGLGLLEKAQELKKKGKIRHISFSFHDTPDALKYIIDNGVGLETMLVQYNLLDRSNEEMIRYAREKGLGVAVMGPVGGGRLAAPTELSQKLGSGSLPTYELALRFVLGNPNVCVALSGMQTEEMVVQNAAVASLECPMTEDQWQQAGQAMEDLKKFSELYCTGCGYCQPCPKKVNIPLIFQIYTYHNVYGLREAAKNAWNRYLADPNFTTSKECADCGYCERKCPQHLKIREQLKKVETVLNSL